MNMRLGYDHLGICILEVRVKQVEFFEWLMSFFIWFGVVVASDTFFFNVIKNVPVSVRFREIP